jgi:hypothetical protein
MACRREVGALAFRCSRWVFMFRWPPDGSELVNIMSNIYIFVNFLSKIYFRAQTRPQKMHLAHYLLSIFSFYSAD